MSAVASAYVGNGRHIEQLRGGLPVWGPVGGPDLNGETKTHRSTNPAGRCGPVGGIVRSIQEEGRPGGESVGRPPSQTVSLRKHTSQV